MQGRLPEFLRIFCLRCFSTGRQLHISLEDVQCRKTAETGVVDKELKVHGYPDFYITDGSVIQGNIGVNPSLTITAMAEYCMSRIPSKDGTQLYRNFKTINTT